MLETSGVCYTVRISARMSDACKYVDLNSSSSSKLTAFSASSSLPGQMAALKVGAQLVFQRSVSPAKDGSEGKMTRVPGWNFQEETRASRSMFSVNCGGCLIVGWVLFGNALGSPRRQSIFRTPTHLYVRSLPTPVYLLSRVRAQSSQESFSGPRTMLTGLDWVR